MAKTKTQSSADAKNATDNQQGKKQAKQEAKLMLKLEQARRSVQKAEQKAAKARSKLEANEQYVREVEQQLAQLRGTQPEAPGTNGSQQEPTAVDQGDQYDLATLPEQEASLPPAEGREDISVPQTEQATSVANEQPSPVDVTTGDEHSGQFVSPEGSTAVVTEDTTPTDAEQTAPGADQEIVAPDTEQEAVVPIVAEIVSAIVEDDRTLLGEETTSPEAEQEAAVPIVEEIVSTTAEDTVTPLDEEPKDEEDSSENNQQETAASRRRTTHHTTSHRRSTHTQTQN